MSSETNTSSVHVNMRFVDFLIKDRNNRLLFYMIITSALLQFFVFKLFYPFPDFSTDSQSYIFAASKNLDINLWPIGYSKFLSLFHGITHSAAALICFQYFFLEFSEMYLFFTILFFYHLSRSIRIILFVFLFINPLLLYLSNYIGSDCVFAAFSILWLSELLWIFKKSNFSHIILHTIFIFLCFTIRNNAYYYPIVAIIAILMSRQQIWVKLLTMGLPFLLISTFIVHTRNEAYKLTGSKQFSLFTGWQLANNALYMYDMVRVDNTKFSSPECKDLDWVCRRFFKTSGSWTRHKDELTTNEGNFFIQYVNSPLKKYLRMNYKVTDDYSQLIAWGKVSPIYEKYGTTLITQHPLEFGEYFLCLNSTNYFLPPLEKLQIYNRGIDELSPLEQDWFEYKTPSITAASPDIQGYILFIFSPLFLILNLYLLGTFIWLMLKPKYMHNDPHTTQTILLLTTFLLINFWFSIFATINVLRYQVFPMIVCAITLSLAAKILNKQRAKHEKESIIQEIGKIKLTLSPTPSISK